MTAMRRSALIITLAILLAAGQVRAQPTGTGGVELSSPSTEASTLPSSDAPAAGAENPPPVSFGDFTDLDESAWYAPYVAPIVFWGIASGYRDAAGNFTGRFGPGDPVTVAQLMKMAMHAARIDVKRCAGEATPSTADHWAMPYVACGQALRLRILRKRLDIDRPILRGEAVALIHDVFRTDVPPLSSAFADTRHHPYSSDIAYAAARQIVSGPTDLDGRPTGSFLPQSPLTRAETAKMLFLTIHTEQSGGTELLHPVILDLHARNYKFSPATLTVRRSQPVMIRIRSEGLHTFTLEAFHIDHIISKPEESIVFIPDRSGTFRFACRVPGHADSGMVGTLIVQ